ncbi:MAG TPA: TlpA disulfide reductase family protein, partial [Gemmataceae bacterium]|nr:TlpA disulfide reductase family protein [Gemmataceae bacterium]
MRRIWAGLFILTVAAAPLLLRGDAKAQKADDKAEAKTAPKAPAEELGEITSQFNKDFTEAVTAFRTAKDDKSREEAKNKAFKLPETYAAKMIAFAEKHPNDPTAVDALMWVCVVPSSRGLPIAQKTLMLVRDKSKSDVVKIIATDAMANQIFEKEDRTPAQTKEAEGLYAEVVTMGRNVKDLPKEVLENAEGNLFELRNLVIGQAAPEAESNDIDGKAVKLSDHKGKVVVLDFWATWCGPCVGMIPHERDMVKKHEGKPFVFISVSADEKKEKLKEFLEKEKMPWTHWWNGQDGGVVKKWNVRAFPTMYIVDAKGVLRAKIVGGGD